MPFTYEGTQLRTVVIDGDPWFVARDICNVLELPNLTMAMQRLADAEKGVNLIDTPGGKQQMAIVNESGMYALVLRSDKPEAEKFRRWITGKVLPSIRKTGSYSAAPALTGAELLAAAVLEAQAMLTTKDERIAELEPKADLADTYLTAQGGARLVREAAKLLGMKERELRRFLLDEKLVFVKHAACGDVQYDHYAQFAHHFKATEHVVRHTWGNCSHYTLTILPRGMELIAKRRGQLAVSA